MADSGNRDRADEVSPQSGNDSTLNDVVDSSADDLNRLRDDLNEATQRALRAQADLENYRKRIQREVDEERKFANLPLLRDLLPVVDNISRAIEAAEKSGEAPSLLAGFRMVGKQLEDVLTRYGAQKIEAQSQPFDPHLHEAISQQASDVEPHTVLHVAQDGYRLHERVLRPSQVIVSSRNS